MISFRKSKLRARNKPCSVRSAHVMINSKTSIKLLLFNIYILTLFYII